jgi:protoporphyrinogen IX oxidase
MYRIEREREPPKAGTRERLLDRRILSAGQIARGTRANDEEEGASMLWFLTLHIIAIILWCGALLYLPPLVASAQTGRTEVPELPHRQDSLARFVFTHLATPMAFLAIVSGTIVFLMDRTIEVWLLAKLTAVAGLGIGHTLVGGLVLWAEDEDGRSVSPWCWMLEAGLLGLVAVILWLVLAKPTLELLPWTL